MTSKLLKESEELDELKTDNQRIKDFKKGKGNRFMEQIVLEDNKRLDELHSKFLIENNIVDMEEWQLVKMVFDFLKEQNKE